MKHPQHIRLVISTEFILSAVEGRREQSDWSEPVPSVVEGWRPWPRGPVAGESLHFAVYLSPNGGDSRGLLAP